MSVLSLKFFPQQQRIQHLVVLLMLHALLLPLYAPWINTQFAANIPSHKHLYLGKYNPNHHHHQHPSNSGEKAQGIAFLPNFDATQHSLIDLALHLYDTLIVPGPDSSLSFPHPNQYTQFKPVYLSPETPPPR
ncbi:MAG: hypothetical protein ACE5E7_14700 [Anaerolineae bacterium]